MHVFSSNNMTLFSEANINYWFPNSFHYGPPIYNIYSVVIESSVVDASIIICSQFFSARACLGERLQQCSRGELRFF
jgi:hypothetical protein